MKLTLDLKTIHQVVTEAVDEASRLYVFGEQAVAKKQKNYLPSQSQLVTKADEQIDEFLRNELGRQFPDFGFITEENRNVVKEVNWIIDPIDGTGNFFHGLPFFGISVGLWMGNEPIYGQIYIPKLNERVWAGKKLGAYFQDKPIKAEEHEGHLYATLAPVGDAAETARLVKAVSEVVGHPRDFGSCVFQAVQVCLGRTDLLVGYRLSLWDLGAIAAIATEAGLNLVTLYGNKSVAELAKAEYGLTFILAVKKVKPEILHQLKNKLKDVHESN